MIHEPLQFYVDKLKNGEHFSLARYGDGEFYCMWGRQGRNSNGCAYSPELRDGLLMSMRHKNDPSFIYGMQRVLPSDRIRAKREYPDVEWHDSEIFSIAVAEGKLYPLIEQLRGMRVTVIGNESISEVTKEIFDWKSFIFVPPFDAYEHRDRVIKEILTNETKSNVFLFSCGMAANAFIGELHGQVDGWLIDLGHIWDPFTGNMSRCDLEGKTMEEINKNLYETTE